LQLHRSNMEERFEYLPETFDQMMLLPNVPDFRVTVQVVKTGITPQFATSDRLREAKTEPLHPAGWLHMRR